MIVLGSLCGLGLMSTLGLLFVLLVIGALALCFRMFVLRKNVVVTPRALFVLAHAALTGGIVALVTELLLHNG